MKTAIVIPSAGGEKILMRCINSIYAHTKVEFGLCIVSQGELGAHDYLKIREKQFNNFYVHYNEYNEPGSRGYNKGIKLAYEKISDFDYLCFLDDDILVLQSNWLKNLITYLEQHQDVGIVGYKICCLGEPNENDSVLEMMSCCMLCRRQLIDQIGLMDENLLWHRNDSDYCWRAWEAGWRVCVIRANDNGDQSNDYLYHSHQIATRRLLNEENLRKETYRRFDEKWAGKKIEIK